MEQGNRIWSWMLNHPISTIVVWGVFLRIVIAVFYQHITIYPDSGDYIELANRILSLNIAGYEGQRSPGYPFLLALSNGSMVATVFIQCILGITTLVFCFKTALLLNMNVKRALILTIAIASYIPVIFFEFAILTETLTLFVMTLTFYTFFRITANKNRSSSNYFLLAVYCGTLVLIKPFYIFLPFVFVFCLLFRQKSFNIIAKKYSLLLLIPSLVFLGWSGVNKMNTGYFVSTTFYGFNIAQNCVSFAENTSDQYNEIGQIYATHRDKNIAMDKKTEMSIWDAHDDLNQYTQLSFPDLSALLYDYSMTTIKQNPIAYAKQVGISWANFWKTTMYWQEEGFVNTSSYHAFLIVSTFLRFIQQLVKIWFIILIPIYLLSSIKRKRRKLFAESVISLVIATASILQAMATYGTNSRFSFPFEILMLTVIYLFIFKWKKRVPPKI